jgi:hypothetical protein
MVMGPKVKFPLAFVLAIAAEASTASFTGAQAGVSSFKQGSLAHLLKSVAEIEGVTTPNVVQMNRSEAIIQHLVQFFPNFPSFPNFPNFPNFHNFPNFPNFPNC